MGNYVSYYCSPRHYKKWRYPGVPIPHRLRDKYTIDGKRPKFR